MISVTSKSRYAVVAMAELARSGEGPVPIAQLAERREMPVQFLEQLFSTLRRDGLLTSQRGVKGGYTLSRPADQITVIEVVQALDGKVGEEADEAGGIWAEGVEALRDVFGQTTIADIARREAERPAPACTTSRGEQRMRSLRYSINVTLDRLLPSRGRAPAGRGVDAHWTAEMARADALLFGRVTCEMRSRRAEAGHGTWPARSMPGRSSPRPSTER